jgi:nitrous oxidase accessory protein
MKWLLLFICGLVSANDSLLYAATLHVGPNHDFQTISSAVDAAMGFDEIIVHPGIYKERQIAIDKPLKLIGQSGTIIDAENEANDIFLVTSDCVDIEGFTLRNVAPNFRYECAAIRIRGASFINLKNNLIEDCFFGIYLETAARTEVVNNRIVSRSSDEATAGNAIHAWKSNHLRIYDNVLTGHRDGIYFEFVDDSVIERNESYGNLRYGLHFMFSNRDAYRGNTFRNNSAGVAVMFSHFIEMSRNAFLDNWGGASYGLLLKEISDGQIRDNVFNRNTIGVLAEGANRLQIIRNQFTRNGTAIDIKGNCLDNLISANNFLANTFEVVTNSKYNNNVYSANYWSGYKGYDLDRDGVGDVPYRPVNLFAKITHEIPAAALLLHSSIVDILEIGEKNFPLLIPLELTDSLPQLLPYHYDKDF